MLRNRIIHQNELIYVGPAFESGQTYANPITSNLDKVQSISYDFSYQKSEIAVVGKSSSVDRPATSSPVVNLNLEYVLSSFHNENVIGFNVTPSGLTSRFSLISGLCDEDDRAKDKRNLYLATSKDGTDLIGGETGDVDSVLCFHDCQINSYNLNFAVRELPKGAMSLEGISASYFSSGSGLSIDVLDRQSASRASGVDVDIPMSGDSKLISKSDVFSPESISVAFYDSVGSSLTDSGFAPVANNKIQTFSLGIDLPRRSINLPDHKIVYDKLINTPIVGSASIDFIEHGDESGNLTDLIDDEKSYRVVTTIKNKSNSDVMTVTLNDVKIDSIGHSNNIGDNKSSNIELSYPVDPFNINKSINLSGSL